MAAPVLTLNGDSEIVVEKFFPYVDAGATSDGGELVNTTNPVDTLIPSVYQVDYIAQNNSNEIGTASRTVTVLEGPDEISRGFGTFAVSTNDKFHRLPSRPAKELRISNFTGKLVGIRNRHTSYLLDDFENGFGDWELRDGGTIEDAQGIHIDQKSANIKGRVCKKVPYLGDEFIIELFIHAMHGEVKVGLFDTLARTDLISSGNAGTTISFTSSGAINTSAPSVSRAKWKEGTTYKLSIEVHPTKELFTAELFNGINRQVIAQGLDTTNDDGGGGGVKNPASGYYLAIEATNAVIDQVVYLRKDNQTHEIIAPNSSIVYDCVDNVNEYEIVNLGSEERDFEDNIENVTLTGYFK